MEYTFTTIAYFIIVLGVLIFVHEFGHFLTARFFGVGVERFSLGFGPRLFGFQRGRTDYRVSAIPLGGYVKMVGEDPDAEIEEEDIPESFTHQPVLSRILIVVAGPISNFLLPIIIFYGLFQFQGIRSLEPIIGKLETGMPAQAAGLQNRDRVTAVNNTPVKSFEQLRGIIEATNGKAVAISVLRDGKELTVTVQPEMATRRNDFGEEIQTYSIGVFPLFVFEVEKLLDDGSAIMSGLKTGDQIISIDGRPIIFPGEITEIIGNSQGRTLKMIVKRGGEKSAFYVKPERHEGRNEAGQVTDRYMIGISYSLDFAWQYKRNGPVDTFLTSLSETWKYVRLTFISLSKMISGSLAIKDSIGGPIMIAQLAGETARQGLYSYLSFIAIISISLAILNLLPIPVLDGGHLFFYMLEIIRRKPVDLKTREMAQQFGMIVLLSLMALVIYIDIARWMK